MRLHTLTDRKWPGHYVFCLLRIIARLKIRSANISGAVFEQRIVPYLTRRGE